eukprot:6055721-Amphidinium_carterae.1
MKHLLVAPRATSPFDVGELIVGVHLATFVHKRMRRFKESLHLKTLQAFALHVRPRGPVRWRQPLGLRAGVTCMRILYLQRGNCVTLEIEPPKFRDLAFSDFLPIQLDYQSAERGVVS